MRPNWIPTNEHYRRIIDTVDAASRHELYMELLVKPWKQMMDMMSSTEHDELAGARRWAWLLPDQVDEMSAILEKLEVAGTWNIGKDALGEALSRFEPYASRIPFDTVTGWLALADPKTSNKYERGYTGATDWFQPRFIGQFWEPNEHNLPRVSGLVAHEMHHLIRMRAFPFDMQNTTVADYIIIEGTAESFAASLFGEDKVGYFITEFDPTEFETARKMIGAGLDRKGFNIIRSYIFGDALAEKSGYEPLGGMPTYGGYAIGYHVVQAFLKRSGKTIEETTFLHANEIVQGSGFFE